MRQNDNTENAFVYDSEDTPANPAQVTEAMVEAASRAYASDLFSDDVHEAHRAASPWQVEAAREPIRMKIRAALEAAAISPSPAPGALEALREQVDEMLEDANGAYDDGTSAYVTGHNSGCVTTLRDIAAIIEAKASLSQPAKGEREGGGV